MKTLIVFNKPVIIPDDNKEKLVIYGFLADQDKWERCAYKRDYTNYIFVVSELFKEGIVSHTGYDFKKDGVPFFYADPTWKEYEEKVRKNDLLQYAVVDEAVEIDDDQLEDLLTSKEKWSEIIGKGGAGMASITIPTVIFRAPIPTNEGYDVQGLLLAFGKYREVPDHREGDKRLGGAARDVVQDRIFCIRQSGCPNFGKTYCEDKSQERG